MMSGVPSASLSRDSAIEPAERTSNPSRRTSASRLSRKSTSSSTISAFNIRIRISCSVDRSASSKRRHVVHLEPVANRVHEVAARSGRVELLDDEAVGPELVAIRDVALPTGRGDHDDGNVSGLAVHPQLAQSGPAV